MSESGDCKSMLEAEGHFIDGLQWCNYNSTWDACTGEEISCNATARYHNETINGTCTDMLDYFGIDMSEGDDECVWEDEGDCMEMVGEFIEGIESCSYWYVYDECTGEDISCDVSAFINGEWIENTCDWFEENYELPSEDDDCVEWETYDCMDMIPEEFMDSVTSCTYDSAYNYCDDYEMECWATVEMNGVYLEDTCDGMMDEFNIEPSYGDWSYGDDEECGVYEEEGDCMEMLAEYNIEGVESCYYWHSYDECTDEESCWVEMYVNGEFHEGTCEQMEEHWGMDSDYDSEDDDETCTQWGEPMDCWEEYSTLVDGLYECEFWETYDCNDEYRCKARVNVWDEWIEAPCDDIMDMFGLSDDDEPSGDEECWMEQEGPIDCTYDFEEIEFDECQYWLEYDTCTGEEHSCYAEVKFQGEDYHGDCEELMDMFGVEDDDESDWEECFYQESGNCKEELNEMGYETPGLDFCSFNVTGNSCENWESCNVTMRYN